MIKYSILSLCISTCVYSQTYQSFSPRDKQTLISLEREYNHSQGNANEIGQQEYIYSADKSKLLQVLGKTVNRAGTTSISRKESFEYDAQNRINRVVEEEKDENGVMAIKEEILYEYNTANNPTQITRNEYNSNSDEFDLKEKYTLSYTPNGKVSQIQWYDEYDDLTISDTFSYNTQNQVEELLRTNGTGENVEKRTYQYTQGVCTGYIAETVDNNGDWENSHKITLEYDAANENITAETHYSFTNGSWEEGIRIEYQHDLQKLNTQTYTHQNYLHYIGTHDWFTNKNTITETRSYTYDTANSAWKQTKNTTFTYIDNIPLSVKEISTSTPNKTYLYPNPAQEYFKIHSEKTLGGTLNLIDASGKIIRTYNTKEKQFSVQGIEKGLYFVQTNQETIKLIIK